MSVKISNYLLSTIGFFKFYSLCKSGSKEGPHVEIGWHVFKLLFLHRCPHIPLPLSLSLSLYLFLQFICWRSGIICSVEFPIVWILLITLLWYLFSYSSALCISCKLVIGGKFGHYICLLARLHRRWCYVLPSGASW